MYEKALIISDSGIPIPVMFNPASYNLDTHVNYNNINVPGLDGPITQFISGSEDTLSLQLMLNTYKPPSFNKLTGSVKKVSDSEMVDVSKYTKMLYDLTKIVGMRHRPPVCTFVWGSLRFRGVVSDLKVQFTMFLENGKPVRAIADITFKSVLDAKLSRKQSPWESPDRTKYRVLDESSSLWQLAFEEYGDAGCWKEIAKANGIVNPLDIKPGMEIRLPPLKL